MSEFKSHKQPSERSRLSDISNMDKDLILRDQHLISLADSLYQKRSSFSDITLECDGGIIRAHRNVLSASCNYFDAMFRSNLKETNTGKVQFKDINVSVMDIVVRFLYTGTIVDGNCNVGVLKQVISTAHLMQISSLLKVACNVLIRMTNVDNYISLWNLALHLDQTQLIDNILEFINNNFGKFEASGNYVALTLDQLSSLLHSADGKHSADKLVRIALQWVGNDTGERLEAITQLMQILNLDGLSNGCLYALTQDNRITQSPEILHSLFTISANRLQPVDTEKVVRKILLKTKAAMIEMRFD